LLLTDAGSLGAVAKSMARALHDTSHPAWQEAQAYGTKAFVMTRLPQAALYFWFFFFLVFFGYPDDFALHIDFPLYCIYIYIYIFP
jgi:hypothetical protein